VLGISPSRGPQNGGTVVTLDGSGLGGVVAVRFGDTSALSFTVDSFNRVTAVAPPHAPGRVPVSVLRGGTWSLPSEATTFTYEAIVAAQPIGTDRATPEPTVTRSSCVVPDLRGRTVRGARTWLARAGCSLGRVTRAQARRGHTRVRVARQGRRAGSRLPHGTAVAVVLVARGPRSTTRGTDGPQALP
jgi:hypothetical protein